MPSNMKTQRTRNAILKALGILVAALAIALAVSIAKEQIAHRETTEKKQPISANTNLSCLIKGDAEYAQNMDTVVLPYNDQRKEEGFFDVRRHKNENSETLRLHYQVFKADNAQANVVMSVGFTEACTKYAEAVYYFLQSGFNVFIYDYRDMGHSTRTESNPSLTHADSFDCYIDDFEVFMNEVALPLSNDNALPLYLFTHSMGGAVGVKALEDHPEYFEKAVLSSPMVYENTGFPIVLAKTMANIMCALGKSQEACLGYGDYDSREDFEHCCSTSYERYRSYKHKQNNDVSLQNCAPTYGWLRSSLVDTKSYFSERNLQRISTPCLIIQDTNDTVVFPAGASRLVNGMQDARLVETQDAKHEIYRSEDEVLAPYFNSIFEFFYQ